MIPINARFGEGYVVSGVIDESGRVQIDNLLRDCGPYMMAIQLHERDGALISEAHKALCEANGHLIERFRKDLQQRHEAELQWRRTHP